MLVKTRRPLLRVNLGCGATPTPGWLNLDNSPTVGLAAMPWLWPLLPPNQRTFAKAARDAGIRRGLATKLKLPSGSVEVLYSSHMLEHLDEDEAAAFLHEAHRVLAPGGIIRLAVPDIRTKAEDYLKHGDADLFMREWGVGTARPRTVIEWLKHVLVGPRHHLWMYDGPSLQRHLPRAGFASPQVVPAGQTLIADPGSLDLAERHPESVFVEAVKPAG